MMRPPPNPERLVVWGHARWSHTAGEAEKNKQPRPMLVLGAAVNGRGLTELLVAPISSLAPAPRSTAAD